MSKRRKLNGLKSVLITILFVGCILWESYENSDFLQVTENENKQSKEERSFELTEIPEFCELPYVVLNNNLPFFTENEYTTEPFEKYSDLDELGRCGVAFANVCQEIMPNQKRGEIGNIKPTGWHTVRYDDLVEGKYLYNRCHLIGYQLAGENANEKNLITGTRYMNVNGMLPFENQMASYVSETNHHVLYRVTPIFEEENLVAKGVQMEAFSVEDQGKGICFHVFVYNAQPQITINYATGESSVAND